LAPADGTPTESVVERIARRIDDAAGGVRPIVLVDGRSGAGKSTFATALAARLHSELVRLDDVYPGWDGLEAGSRAVHTEIIPTSRWHRWSWEAGERTTSHTIDPDRPLVVEGCGALSRAARRLATFGVWIELDDATRKDRALTRDGDTYAPHWERWARQEESFAAREHPRSLADLVLDGSTIRG
jgi:uridine kinase